MVRDDWESIWTLDETNLRVGHPWYFATDIIGDWTLLRLTAEGNWACLGDAVKPCGPNGHPSLPLVTDRLLVAAAAPGALIGKFGGSIGGRSDGTVFAIGAQCVIAMPEKKSAQLFIGINGAIADTGNRLDRIKLELCGVVDA